jgi:DNA-binding MarR family transcriptional regulator
MKKKSTIDINDENFCCPMGSLTRLSKIISKMFRSHFSKLNVTNSQVGIFMILAEKGETTQGNLGKMMEIERSTISRDLVRLVDQGYLYKAKGGKSPLIGLTKKGQELGADIKIEWEKGYHESRDILGEEGLAALKELEKRILDNKDK